MGLGQARTHLGFRWRALKAFDAAIAQDHLTSSAYYGKAATLQDLLRLKKVLDALEQTIALDINNSSAWRQKADLLARMSARFDEADDAYHALLKLDSQNAGHWKKLGLLHMRRFGKTPHELTALDAFLEATKYNQDDREVWQEIRRLADSGHLKRTALHAQADKEIERLARY